MEEWDRKWIIRTLRRNATQLLFPGRFADFRTAQIGEPGSPEGRPCWSSGVGCWKAHCGRDIWAGVVKELMAMLEIYY